MDIDLIYYDTTTFVLLSTFKLYIPFAINKSKWYVNYKIITQINTSLKATLPEN